MSHPLLLRNHAWAADRTADDPEFFERAAAVHAPHTLYIGCSDARVPANVVTRTAIGEMFVHRNIANQVQPWDASFAAGLEFAVEVLGVRHIVVCGHQECGGVRAVLQGGAPFHVQGWLGPLRLLARVHAQELEAMTPEQRLDALVRWNVEEQVAMLAQHPLVTEGWAAGRPLTLHGWVYDIHDGRLREVVRVAPPGSEETETPTEASEVP